MGMNCVHSRQIYTEGKWYCYYCGSVIVATPKSIERYKVKRKIGKALTELERMKLSWYRDEKKWIENIKNRRIVKNNGKKIVVLTDHKGNIRGEMPR
jgi:hypothetical protein